MIRRRIAALRQANLNLIVAYWAAGYTERQAVEVIETWWRTSNAHLDGLTPLQCIDEPALHLPLQRASLAYAMTIVFWAQSKIMIEYLLEKDT